MSPRISLEILAKFLSLVSAEVYSKIRSEFPFPSWIFSKILSGYSYKNSFCNYSRNIIFEDFQRLNHLFLQTFLQGFGQMFTDFSKISFIVQDFWYEIALWFLPKYIERILFGNFTSGFSLNFSDILPRIYSENPHLIA